MPRRALLRWAGWFAAANAGLFALVGLRFLAGYAFGNDALGLVYAVLAFIGHFALLAALPVGLLVVPLLLVVPRRSWVTAVAVLLASGVLTLLVVDGNVFAEQRYHLTPLTAVLFETSTWVFVGVIAAFALLFESLLSGYIWQWVTGAPVRGGRVVAAVLCGAWLASQFIHIWADAIGHAPVTQLTRYLPVYFPIHAKRTLVRWGLVDPAVADRQRLLQRAGAADPGQLRYPLRTLQCARVEHRANILFVLIDALRPDVVDPALTPRLAALQDQSAVFTNHWSGGNSSKAGVFSMFYGLPSTYQETFYGVQRQPVLLDLARSHGYQLGLFAAPGFGPPTDIARTVFAEVPGLPGERRDIGAVDRNRAVTDGWLGWLAGRDVTKPFFGFLYYDPPMGEMSDDPAESLAMDERFTSSAEAKSAWRRYRRSAQMVDGELGRVLDSLEKESLPDSTIVIVLSDHGYEFDDNGLGYIGHASNYSPAQIRATLVVRWPGRPPARYGHRSSHYDIAPSLIEGAFACTNEPADYSLGHNLFAGQDWEWLIAGSYNSHAIVNPQWTIVTHPGGFVELLGADYRPVAGAAFDAGVVAEALSAMRRFYQ